MILRSVGLSAARVAEENDEFAFEELEVDATQGVDLHLALVIDLGDAADFEDGRSGGSIGGAGHGRGRGPPRPWIPATAAATLFLWLAAHELGGGRGDSESWARRVEL